MKKNRAFKIDVSVVFGLLLVFTVGIIISSSFYSNKLTTLKILHADFEKSAISVVTRATAYLKVAEIQAEIAVKLFEDPNFQFNATETVENFLLKAVQLQNQISFLYFGTENGDFIQAGAMDNQFSLRKVKGGITPPEAQYRFFTKDMKLQRSESRVEIYDPRKRPWYIGSKKSGKTFWTDSYIFFEDGKPGITVAAPVKNQDNSLKGVVGTDITLAGLSEILKSVKLSPNSVSFIMDETGTLVAYTDSKKMVRYKDGKVIRLRPQEVGLPFLTKAVRVYEDKKKNIFTVSANNQNYLAYFTSFPESFGKNWIIGILAPEDDFLGSIKKVLYYLLLISLIILLISFFIAIFLANKLSRPIEQLTQKVLEVKDLNLESSEWVRSPIREISQMSAAVESMKKGLRAFKRYVPATLVKQLIESGEDVSIGGKERELTLFFSDIKGFTTISENTSPKELMIQLSKYFNEVCRIIEEEKGTLDKFIGDAVMAFWGAPILHEDHAVRTCRSALRCQKAIRDLNDKWHKEGRYIFETRMGIATGYSIVGNMGSQERMNYSVIGDNVNLAARLEGANKRYGTEIIISKSTYRYIQYDFICRILDQITVKGKSEAVIIYELLAEKDSPDADQFQLFSDKFSHAYHCYENRQWENAKKGFEAVLELRPEDIPSKNYLEKCLQFLQKEPDLTWSPITRLSSK